MREQTAFKESQIRKKVFTTTFFPNFSHLVPKQENKQTNYLTKSSL